MDPLASVLMPVYNDRPDYLSRAVKSISNQGFEDFELIIVDDGTEKEETLECLEELQWAECRLRIVRRAHEGIVASLNAGLEICKGKYVLRQDADDWSNPARLAVQIDYLDNNPDVSLVGSDVRVCREDGALLWEVQLPRTPDAIRRALEYTNPFCHGSVCIRRKCLESIGGYRRELVLAEDYDCFWRLADRWSAANVPQPLYSYRVTPCSLSLSRIHDQIVARQAVRILGHTRRSGLEESITAALLRAEEEYDTCGGTIQALIATADRLLLAGKYSQALQIYVRALPQVAHYPQILAKVARAAAFISVPFPFIRKRLWRLR